LFPFHAPQPVSATFTAAGEQFAAKFGRHGFRRNFPFEGTWRGCAYATKQMEVCAVQEAGEWLVITVVVKYFGSRRV
jgi:hypothetical protein